MYLGNYLWHICQLKVRGQCCIISFRILILEMRQVESILKKQNQELRVGFFSYQQGSYSSEISYFSISHSEQIRKILLALSLSSYQLNIQQSSYYLFLHPYTHSRSYNLVILSVHLSRISLDLVLDQLKFCQLLTRLDGKKVKGCF